LYVLVTALVILPLGALVLLGWLVPLVVGIVRSRRGKGGVGCIVLGGVWGFLALCLLGFVCFVWFSFSQARTAWQPQTFDPAVHTGALGRIEFPHGGDAVLTLQHGGTPDGSAYLQLNATDGVAVAPAGELSIWSCDLKHKDADGNTWQASCYNPKGESGKLTVPTNGVACVALGPPLEARIKTRAMAEGKRSFDLKITGPHGNKFSVRAEGHGRAPGFEVLNAAGETVWTGKFAYG